VVGENRILSEVEIPLWRLIITDITDGSADAALTVVLNPQLAAK
jgi:hypothetical protein